MNPNTILAVDEEKQEYIFFGKGIGYSRKVGQLVEKEDVNRMFIPIDNMQKQEYLRLFDSISPIYFDLAQKIIAFAEEKLETKLNTSIFFTLSDHLSFAIERHKDGIKIVNRVFWEIKNYYPIEFSIGEFALKLIKKELGQILPKEEAANIAFHIINAQNHETTTSKGLEYAKLVGSISDLIKYELGIDYDSEDVHYQRFITHLKFFVERYFEDKLISEDDSSLFEQISSLYPKALIVAFTVKDYVELIHTKKIPKEEIAYLTVHINRLFKHKLS